MGELGKISIIFAIFYYYKCFRGIKISTKETFVKALLRFIIGMTFNILAIYIARNQMPIFFGLIILLILASVGMYLKIKGNKYLIRLSEGFSKRELIIAYIISVCMVLIAL